MTLEQSARDPSQSVWIHSPRIDLLFFSFPWLPFFALYLIYVWLGGYAICDVSNFRRDLSVCGPLMLGIHIATNSLNDIHRFYTFGIVYGDSGEFQKRRNIYLWLPVLLFCLIVPPFAAFKYVPREHASTMLIAFAVVATPEAIWTAIHAMLQKYGLLRAYSSKLGHGDPKIEKAMLLSWLALLVTLGASDYRGELPAYIHYWQRVDTTLLSRILEATRYLWMVVFGISLFLTGSWVLEEVKHASRACWPKWTFALSIALMLAISRYSLIIGYLAFIVAHSIEYITFVNLYGKKKEGLTRWARAPWLSNFAIFAAVTVVFYLLGRHSSALVFGFTIFAAYLHFIYDTFLWRLRKPETRELLLQL